MRKDERAALTSLLDNVGLGFTRCLAECKLLRAYLQRTPDHEAPPTVGDIVRMIGTNCGVSVGTSPDGRPYVSVMMDRIDTPDGRIYDPVLYVDNKHSGMTLDVVVNKIAERAARIHKGRKRTKANPACGNGHCPRSDTDVDANENGERGSPYFGDCKHGKAKR